MIGLLSKLAILSLVFFSIFSHANVIENGQFELNNTATYTIKSKTLGRSYDLYIKTPRGYNYKSNVSRTYPILYLNDGPYTFKVAAGITHMRQMDKVIVVGISFAQGENGQFSRVRDLTPVVDKDWVKYQTGGAPEYLKFIENEVFGFVEKQYRVNSNQRILSGQSLGGSFGAWVLLTKPELFMGYILTSPSLWFKDNWIFDLESSYSKTNTSLEANVYMATGALETKENGMQQEMVGDQLRFVKQLNSRGYKGLKLKSEIINGTDHYSTFPVGLSKGLAALFREMENNIDKR